MQMKLDLSQSFVRITLIALIVLLELAIFFRFAHIERKVYWYDESLTALRITGHTQTEFVQEVFTGDVVPVSTIQQYQQLEPEKELDDTFQALAGNAEHPPLYYTLARLWIDCFGDSITAIRSLSAVISLLAFPCMYWLCRELFDSPPTAWMAMALLSVSPLHILYAQEAREYSLWIVTTLLSSAALLQAVKRPSLTNWSIYAVSAALGLYTFLFSTLVMLAHGIYVVLMERLRLTKKLIAYFIASICSVLTFVPWALIILKTSSKIDQVTTSGQTDIDLVPMIKAWVKNLGCVFFDLNLGDITGPLTLLLVGFALYFLRRRAPQRISLFIMALIGATTVTLMLGDLLLGWSLSTTARYLFPGYVGVQLAVAYLLSKQMVLSRPKWQTIWRFITVAIISGGLASCLMISNSQTWWTKDKSQYNFEIAEIINNAETPLLISDTSSLNAGDILSLSHLLDEHVQLMLLTQRLTPPPIADRFSNIFLFNPSNQLQAHLETIYSLEEAHGRIDLWELKRK
jgi:uncharacterized membrane protein